MDERMMCPDGGMGIFRPMRRRKQALDGGSCRDLLESEKRAAFAVMGDGGYPYAVPVNFYYDRGEEVIYIHGAREGHKMDAIQSSDKVCITVWNQGEKKEGDWAYYVKSVVVFGRAELVKERERLTEKLRLLGCKYYPQEADVDAEIERDGKRVALIAVRIEQMSGKLVHEK